MSNFSVKAYVVDTQWAPKHTVNPEIFAIILFSPIALKYIFGTLKNRDYGKIYLYQ